MISSRKSSTSTAARLRLSALALLLLALAGETALRLAGRTDENGQFWLGGGRVRPYALPVAGTRRALAELAAHPQSYLAADAELGWTIRPEAVSVDGLFRSNAQGLRADRVYAAEPDPGTLRIAAYGDSFTHGDEVEPADTWVARLEAELPSCESLNGGVPGYGLDQAWLRWRACSETLPSHVVVLGFVAEDVYRLVNVLRPLYQPVVSIPFAKPRFVLEGPGATLRRVDSPALRPEQVPLELERLEQSPLAAYEAYFDPADYRGAAWQRSRLLAWLADVPRRDPIARDRRDAPRHLAPESEAGRLALAIVGAFRDEVEARDARFVLLHLPRRPDLDDVRARRPLLYADLLGELGRRVTVVDPSAALAALPDAEAFRRQGHYAPAAHALVARALADALSAPTSPGSTGEPGSTR